MIDEEAVRESMRALEQLRRFAPPPLGTGQLRVSELEGDHTEAERAQLHDGEDNAFESAHLGMYWEDHERRIAILDAGRMIACAEDLGPEYGVLFCRPDRAGLYARLGFTKVDAPVNVAQLDGRRIDMPLDTMWRPLRPHAAWPSGRVRLPGLPF